MAKVTPISRAASGNVGYNLYRFKEDPNNFILIENWKSVQAYELFMKHNNIKRINVDLLFNSNPFDSHWSLKNISE